MAHPLPGKGRGDGDGAVHAQRRGNSQKAGWNDAEKSPFFPLHPPEERMDTVLGKNRYKGADGYAQHPVPEDLPELQCSADDYSPMFTKQDIGSSGIRFDMTRLLMDCMRRSPDRIVVGEVRDGCAYTMLKAWNTGHPGGACTVHADTASSGLIRIESLALEDRNAPNNIGVLRMLIGEAVDVIVSITTVRYKDGTKGRKINEIVELEGYNSMTDKYNLTVI